MALLPPTVIEALEAFSAPDRRTEVQSLAHASTPESRAELTLLTDSTSWVDMNRAHPLGPDRSDPEGIRRMLQKLGAESRCAVLSAAGSEDDRDLGGALDGALHSTGGALVVCRPGPLAFLVTASGEHWLLAQTEPPAMTSPISVIR
ncbi:hypothetical protein ACPEEZ_01565 [Frigoribacterium sp. 2-23]|uniref:hypothetical protein n=1 Tax=Frigoribacterium sp. 2-23 TaxID=3415006 RepID=UPI003C6ED1FA